MQNPENGPVLVGVTGEQPESVPQRGVAFAKAFGRDVVFAWVDTTQYTSGFMSDGTVAFTTFDPDPTADHESDSTWLQERARVAADAEGVSWSTRVGAGQPSAVLGAIADEIGASMIVVGTREPGFIAGLQEFLGGSVAAHLAHTQSRPVVVVPLLPADKGERVPWEPES
ncbi:universal stress protein [Microbacterium sp. MPKO10]|uniref:universal stress protein n=1 Tax=Microbacterium sp. MPKO10 TaxID=2989818 RepID=UPI00223547F0|nr:universal stress protein [Microbacterium sp. MPKO10]MCW4458927.1 universal stress protein [Microbacterium sp. MPKO10]